jgi:hypothetical protein
MRTMQQVRGAAVLGLAVLAMMSVPVQKADAARAARPMAGIRHLAPIDVLGDPQAVGVTRARQAMRVHYRLGGPIVMWTWRLGGPLFMWTV